MISCREAVRRLWDYLERDLSPAQRTEVDDHLALCRDCCGELRFAEEMRLVLSAKTTVDLPEDVERGLLDFVEGITEEAE